jgi:hypothetical protein
MASKRALRRRAVRENRLHIFIRTQHACGNKNQFATADEAEDALRSLMRSSYFDGGPMNVYLCPITQDHWHFGHIMHGTRGYSWLRKGCSRRR